MENSKKEDMVFVSFDRLWDNFKKFWWIAAVLAVVMLLYGAATYKRAISTSGTDENVDQTPVEIPENETDRIHQGKVMVSFTVSVEEYLETIGMSGGTGDLELYQKLCNDVTVYAYSIINSEVFFSSVNEAYAQAGLPKLVTGARYPGDDEYDIFAVNPVSDMAFEMTYTGLGGQERIRIGSAAAAEALVAQLTEICPFIHCSVNSEPNLFLRVYVRGFYGYYDPSEETVARIRQEYEEYNKIVKNEVEKFDFKIRNIFQVSTIIKGLIGFVVGLFVIFIIAVCDKKVRTREELDRFFEGEGIFLGEIRKNAAVSGEVTAASINAMCEKEGIGKVILTTAGKQKNDAVLAELSQKASGGGVEVVCADGIEVSPDTTRAIAQADGTIVFVNGGFDDVHTIKNALSRINTAEGRLLGYILCK